MKKMNVSFKLDNKVVFHSTTNNIPRQDEYVGLPILPGGDFRNFKIFRVIHNFKSDGFVDLTIEISEIS